MKSVSLLVASMCAAFVSVPAAAITFTTSAPNLGPQAPSGFDNLSFYADFDSGAPANLTGGGLRTGSNDSIYAAPFGDMTQYYAVGPNAGSPATLTIANFDLVSLYWGSIDYYNKISFLGPLGSVIQSFTGSQIDGTPMPTGMDSRTVVFSLSPAERALVTGIKFESSVNAFEFDNLAVGSAPEPAVWMTMILGLGVAGTALRRRRPAIAGARLA